MRTNIDLDVDQAIRELNQRQSQNEDSMDWFNGSFNDSMQQHPWESLVQTDSWDWFGECLQNRETTMKWEGSSSHWLQEDAIYFLSSCNWRQRTARRFFCQESWCYYHRQLKMELPYPRMYKKGQQTSVSRCFIKKIQSSYCRHPEFLFLCYWANLGVLCASLPSFTSID